MNLGVNGRVAFVSGGAGGIGRVIAQTLMAHGAEVFVCDVNGEVLEEFLAANPTARGVVADIAVFADVERVFSGIDESFRRLDILVNNAAVAGPTAGVADIEPSEWERAVAVSLNGQFYCTKLAVPMLRAAGGGSIVNISSNVAFGGFPHRSPYTASKWALIGLTKTWAMELGPEGIRVNALCPGSVKGPRIDGVIERDAALRGMRPEEIREAYKRQSSMRLFVEPEDVAYMVTFLCSHLGATISGQAIGIDGHTETLSTSLDSPK